jgi:cysteine desulfuration protein SufE
MKLAEKQADLVHDLSRLPGGQERLAWLVERARQRPAWPEAERTPERLVPGCLAKLWFAASFKDGRCRFACDSESQIVRAIAGLLCEFYSDQPAGEILAHDPGFLAPLGITQHLTPNRRNALARVWERIRTFAAAHNSGNAAQPEQ